MAQSFAQICTVALAAFISSGAGLLTYSDVEPSPGWLRIFVLLSAAVVVMTFIGWAILSLAARRF